MRRGESEGVIAEKEGGGEGMEKWRRDDGKEEEGEDGMEERKGGGRMEELMEHQEIKAREMEKSQKDGGEEEQKEEEQHDEEEQEEEEKEEEELLIRSRHVLTELIFPEFCELSLLPGNEEGPLALMLCPRRKSDPRTVQWHQQEVANRGTKKQTDRDTR